MNKFEKITIIVLAVIGLSIFALIGSNYNNKILVPVAENTKDAILGSAATLGQYTVKATNNWGTITSVPTVLHKIIIGTANDVVYVANDTVTPSTSGVFLITATVPGTFDFETIFSNGIVANVTSTAGVIFVTSPY